MERKLLFMYFATIFRFLWKVITNDLFYRSGSSTVKLINKMNNECVIFTHMFYDCFQMSIKNCIHVSCLTSIATRCTITSKFLWKITSCLFPPLCQSRCQEIRIKKRVQMPSDISTTSSHCQYTLPPLRAPFSSTLSHFLTASPLGTVDLLSLCLPPRLLSLDSSRISCYSRSSWRNESQRKRRRRRRRRRRRVSNGISK